MASKFARIASALAWRTLNPAERGPFLETGRPRALQRLYYRAFDGWQAPLLHLPPLPGAPGEPVLVCHTLLASNDLYRYGRGPTLVGSLRRAGFSVYLMTHRGDRDAIAPRWRTGRSFDDIVEFDVPAALQRVVEHSGYAKVHLVGHGLGGQIGLAWAARGGDRVAAQVAVAAPVQFDTSMSELRRGALIGAFLPGRVRLPARILARLAVPWAEVADDVPGARWRGALHFGSADCPTELLHQLGTWLREGSLTDRTGLFDYREGLQAATGPLLVVVSEGDTVCPPWAGRSAAASWGGPADVLQVERGGHVDLLIGEDASRSVFEPLVAWLDERRRLAWDGS